MHNKTFANGDDILPGTWLTVEVDHLGRVFIVDHQNTRLHLYNTNGTYNRQIWHEGDGPGECRRISHLRTDSRHLHLMDMALQSIRKYDLETLKVTGDVDLMDDLIDLIHYGTGFLRCFMHDTAL